MNEREMFENAHKLLETHFKMKVDNEETLNAWKLFKEDYVKQIEENQAYKAKEDKLRDTLLVEIRWQNGIGEILVEKKLREILQILNEGE